MKNLFLLFVLVFIVSCSQEVAYDSLVIRNGITYEVNSQTPYDGKTVKFFENGQVESKETYIDGKKDGPQESYYKNGQLRTKENFEDGQLEGLREYFFEDGQLDLIFSSSHRVDRVLECKFYNKYLAPECPGIQDTNIPVSYTHLTLPTKRIV